MWPGPWLGSGGLRRPLVCRPCSPSLWVRAWRVLETIWGLGRGGLRALLGVGVWRLVRRGRLGTLGVAWWVEDPGRRRAWVPRGWEWACILAGRAWQRGCEWVTPQTPFCSWSWGGVPSMAASLTPQSPSRVGVRPLESEPGPRACPHLGALGRLDPGTGREWRCRRECGSEGLAGPGRPRAPAARRGNTGWLFRTRAAHGPRENVRGQLRPACGTLALPPGVAAARGGRASLAAGGRAVQADPPEGRQVPTLPHVVWGYSGWGDCA